MTIHLHDWSARCPDWWRYSIPEAEIGELDKLWVISKYHFQFSLMIFISLFGKYLFLFLSLNLLFSINIPQCPTWSFQLWHCHFENEAGKKQVVVLDARSHLFLSWQPLLRWVYLQVQLLSSPKLHVWNKNVFRSEVWLTLSEGQLCIWHEGWRGLPPSTQTTKDVGQQGAVPSQGEEALSLAH